MSDMKDLVRMANQIADFFSAYPDEEAIPGIAGHLRDFWTPPMRERIAAHVAAGGAGLRPLAVAAVRRLPARAA